MHGDDEMLHGLRERVHDAEAQRSRVAHRTAAVAPDSTGAARAEGGRVALPTTLPRLDRRSCMPSSTVLMDSSSCAMAEALAASAAPESCRPEPLASGRVRRTATRQKASTGTGRSTSIVCSAR